MSFVNPLFLFGLLAAALPVIIHLLTRDRIRKVTFSTLRFFAGVSQRVLRRRRFQEMVLLALRVVACALLAVAFARPFFANKSPAGAQEQAHIARVILADVSGSMARSGLADALRQEAATALSDLQPGRDLVALVTFADLPTTVVRLTREPGDIRAAVAKLQPTEGGTDLAAALKAADALLRDVAAPTKQIVLISDFQKIGWRNFAGDWKLAPAVALVPRAVPVPEAGAVAIVKADCPSSLVLDHAPRPMAARVANFSGRDLAAVTVSLELDGREIDAQKVRLRPGGTADVRFRHVFDRTGNHPGCLRVRLPEGAAAAAAQDAAASVYYFNAHVAPQIKVVVLDGRPAAQPLQDAATFLRLALPPGSAFTAQVLPASSARPEDLKDARVVILADVAQVSPELRAALGDLVGRGGGLLFLPGDSVSAQTFNQAFAGLVPCELQRVLAPAAGPGKPAETHLVKIDYEHPAFNLFSAPGQGDLSQPHFRRFWEVSYLGLSGPQPTRVLARFTDGERPAILERRIGQGQAILIASPPNLQWTDLPLRSIYLPLLHETLLHLAVRTDRPTAFVVGDRPALPADHKLEGPGGARVADPGQGLATPGFYTEVLPDGSSALVLAVNRPPLEADPTPITPDKIAAAIETATAAAPAAAGESAGPERRKQDGSVWWYAMVAVAAALVGELWLGNKTLRH